MGNRGTCSSPLCNKEIEWVEIEKADGSRGKLPLDARLVKVYGPPDQTGMAPVLATGRVSHFLTCPDASRFSKKGGK